MKNLNEKKTHPLIHAHIVPTDMDFCINSNNMCRKFPKIVENILF